MIKFAAINPLKFINQSTLPDRNLIFNNPDNTENDGMQISLSGRDLKCQIQASDSETLTADLYNNKNEFIKNITVSDITPSGWTADVIYQIAVNHNVQGFYYVKLVDSLGVSYKSNTFHLLDASDLRNNYVDIVQIEFSHYQNDLGFIFGHQENAIALWFFGTIRETSIKADKSTASSDRGKTQLLQSTPKRGLQFQTTQAIPQHLSKSIELALCCSYVVVNGIRITFVDDAKPEALSETMTSVQAEGLMYEWNYDNITLTTSYNDPDNPTSNNMEIRTYKQGTGSETLDPIPAGYYLSDVIVDSSGTSIIDIGTSPSLNNVMSGLSVTGGQVVNCPNYNSSIVGSTYIVTSTGDSAVVSLIFIKYTE